MGVAALWAVNVIQRDDERWSKQQLAEVAKWPEQQRQQARRGRGKPKPSTCDVTPGRFAGVVGQ